MMMENQQEKRSETRELLDRFYSVEFLIKETGEVYQFKLRDISTKGLGILVREDSRVLQYIKLSDTLDVKYNPPRSSDPTTILKTRIRHITKKEQGAPGGHFVIGLEVITKQPAEKEIDL
jgi:hypothetical protein